MKCMVIVKASKDSEKGVMPGPELLAAMGKYNEELIKAGIMQGGGGLKPTSEGKRVRFSGAQRTVVSGPFTPTEEQISGYWLCMSNLWTRRWSGSSVVPIRCSSTR